MWLAALKFLHNGVLALICWRIGKRYDDMLSGAGIKDGKGHGNLLHRPQYRSGKGCLS